MFFDNLLTQYDIFLYPFINNNPFCWIIIDIQLFCTKNQITMKGALATIFLLLIFSTVSLAQDYKTGIGIRGGSQSGITVKHFFSEKSAIEGLVATRYGGFYLTGLYEVVGPYFGVEGFNWYMGAGAHVGFLDGDNSRFEDNKNHTVAGLDGIIGFEYKFAGAPICLGLDWKPQYDFIGDSYFIPDDFALSLRFTFGSKKSSSQE